MLLNTKNFGEVEIKDEDIILFDNLSSVSNETRPKIELTSSTVTSFVMPIWGEYIVPSISVTTILIIVYMPSSKHK